MYKNCRILNKNTNKISFGQIDTELEGKNFYELVEIPDNGNVYIFQNGQVIEFIQTKTEREILLEQDYIQTTIGRLKKQTPVGDLPTVMNSLFNLVNIAGVLPAGTLRFYREDDTYFYNADMTKEEFTGLYLEFIQAYKALDTAI